MAGESAVSLVSKPQMRGLLQSQIKKNLFVAITLSIISGFVFKFTVADVRKRQYAEFYRTYDADKEFEVMKKKGLFQSC